MTRKRYNKLMMSVMTDIAREASEPYRGKSFRTTYRADKKWVNLSNREFDGLVLNSYQNSYTTIMKILGLADKYPRK